MGLLGRACRTFTSGEGRGKNDLSGEEVIRSKKKEVNNIESRRAPYTLRGVTAD